MNVRPSGGRLVVTVRKRSGPRWAFINDRFGWWTWTVPAPKGHPQPPSWRSLQGTAHTQAEAVAAGLARLHEVYGGAS